MSMMFLIVFATLELVYDVNYHLRSQSKPYKTLFVSTYSNFFLCLKVTCEYTFEHGACVPKRVHTVVVSVQHSEKISLDELRSEIRNKVVKEVIPARYLDENTTIHINPCGLFIIGGPQVCSHFIFTKKINNYMN